MPYSIIKQDSKGYKVCKTNEPDICFSKEPIPLERAKKQLKAIGMHKGLNPLFGRIGGKSHLRKEIVENYFPIDYEEMTYVEPFAGGASIYFYKKPSIKEIINDKDGGIIDVFRMFKKYDGADIKDVINKKYTKEDFDKIKSSTPKNDFERGIKELLLSRLSFFSNKKNFTESKSNVSSSFDNKYKDRLKHTIILNEDYTDVIKKYDSKNTFFYLDPPYENSKGLYNHYHLPIQDLYNVLKKIKGKFLLSYNNSDDAKRIFKDYNIYDVSTTYTDPIKGGQDRKVKEILISNYLQGGSINIKKLEGFGDEVKEVEEEPMDDAEIKEELGPNTKILKYSDLSKYNSIEQLLPNKKDYVVLLYLDAPNKGHWTCIVRNNNDLYYFCSYGSKVDSQLLWVSPQMRMRLGIPIPFITRLFNNADNFNIYYNPIKYQSDKTDINTCGRYVTLFILQFKKHQMNLDDFYKYMNHMKKKYNLSYDEIASTLVSE